MENLKYIDYFGAYANFTVKHRQKYYSISGGILSIISTLFIILFFILFSKAFFLREKRKETVLSLYGGYKTIKFNEQKIWLPWVISNYEGNPQNFSGLIFPKFYYYWGKRDPETKTMGLDYIELNYKLCNETDLVHQNFILPIELSKTYCVEMDNLLMGGDYVFTDYIYQIELNFHICSHGGNYDPNDTACISYEKLKSTIGETDAWNLGIYYPDVQFHPNNFDNPLVVSYRNYYYHFSIFSTKIDRLFLQEHTLNDDKGWVFERGKNLTYWGIEKITGDTYSLGGDSEIRDIIGGSSTSRLYSLNVFLSPFVNYYQRSYTKFFEMISEFFPILNLLYIIFDFISYRIKLSELQKTYFDNLFEYSENKQNNESKVDLMNQTPDFISLVPPENRKKISELKLSNVKNNTNPKPITLDKKNKKGQFPEESGNEILHRIGRQSSNLVSYSRNLSNELLMTKKDIKRFKIYHAFTELCSCRFEKVIPKSFLLMSNFINQLYDINIHINLVKEFSLLKFMMSNDEDIENIESPKKLQLRMNYDLMNIIYLDTRTNKLNAFNYMLKKEKTDYK